MKPLLSQTLFVLFLLNMIFVNSLIAKSHDDKITCRFPNKPIQTKASPSKEQVALDKELLSKYSNMSPLEMESRPGSENVILVDFDGFQLPSGSEWNNGQPYEAAPIDWDDLKLKKLWAEVADKFSVFDVNVTTNESVFAAANNTNRQRIVITPSVSFTNQRNYGIAQLNSFSKPYDSPCWVFMSYENYTTDEAGDVGAHELGHTFSLEHQGTRFSDYYQGHDHSSHDGWVPIMGFSNRRMIAHWSNSEFQGAVANQDDLAKLAIKMPYIEDDHSDTRETASELVVDGNGTIDGELMANIGLINNRTDIDFFKFKAGLGPMEITIKPRPLNGSGVIDRSMLDIEAKLYDESGAIIETAETGHKNFLEGAVFSFNLPSEQTYYISVDGYGTGDPITGYSDYSSIGPYSVSGTVPPSEMLSIQTIETNPLKVYPIPAKDHLTIESKAVQYKIINLLGELVQEGKVTSQKQFVPLETHENGLYMLKLFHENKVSTKSFLIQN